MDANLTYERMAEIVSERNYLVSVVLNFNESDRREIIREIEALNRKIGEFYGK